MPRDQDENPGWTMFPDFTYALDSIAELSNLNAVEVHFDRFDQPDYWGSLEESFLMRQESLWKVFHAIEARKLGGQEKSTVTCLALSNLQNVYDKELEASSLFQSVIEDIRQLHLHVNTEVDEYGPEYDLHNDHLDWILRMPVLKALYLSETRIMTHASFTESFILGMTPVTHDWERLPFGAYGFQSRNDAVFTYHGRWHYFFGRIKSELKTLVDFRIAWGKSVSLGGDAVPWTREPRLAIEPELSISRYMVFNESRGFSGPGIYPMRNGEMYFGNGNPDPQPLQQDSRPIDNSGVPPANLAEMHEVDDKQALQDLLQATFARRL
ncbi:uncharacterized protein F5Z01DRAFT_656796 [Emericellopsis atlantica]|uniref:Uncharacterized protein n=1 Tax=Emericellopsis atlantica TaxID=2614577 RepID=A0A9P8CNI8_9HYPO|nr:uncharacterized protein F5Z01DRAFT_656796 [Emericellopsis atlantica]KAG9253829.1 hypothetical protein F5Z01DRAFT_656796 [Emericellopsis atlantica]